MENSEKWGWGKLILGVIAGVVLSSGYVKFNWALPGWLQLPGLVQGLGPRTVADSVLEDPAADLAAQQRAVEELFRHDPHFFRQLDDEMDHAITRAAIDRKARHHLQLFQAKVATRRDQLGKHESLREVAFRKYGVETMEDLTVQAGLEDLRADAFLHGYLKARFPDLAGDAELLNAALALKLGEVFPGR